MKEEKYLTMKMAAERLNYSKARVHQLIQTGQLPFRKVTMPIAPGFYYEIPESAVRTFKPTQKTGRPRKKESGKKNATK